MPNYILDFLVLVYLELLLVANLHRAIQAISQNLPYQELQVVIRLQVDFILVVDLMEELHLPKELEVEPLDHQ